MKSIFKSKTFWFGAIQLAIALLQYAGGQIELGATLSLTGFLTIVLRFFTTKPVKI